MQEPLEPVKRKRGRPRKNEYTVRSQDDPNQNWTPESAIIKMEQKQGKAKSTKTTKTKKTRATKIELYPTPELPKNFKLSAISRKYFNTLYYHFEENGIDPKRYMLALIGLSKLYAHEEACEEELKRIGNTVAYKVDSKELFLREHPAAKHLHQTRTLILSYLKSLGLMPNSQDNSQRDSIDSSPFARIEMMRR